MRPKSCKPETAGPSLQSANATASLHATGTLLLCTALIYMRLLCCGCIRSVHVFALWYLILLCYSAFALLHLIVLNVIVTDDWFLLNGLWCVDFVEDNLASGYLWFCLAHDLPPWFDFYFSSEVGYFTLLFSVWHAAGRFWAHSDSHGCSATWFPCWGRCSL